MAAGFEDQSKGLIPEADDFVIKTHIEPEMSQAVSHPMVMKKNGRSIILTQLEPKAGSPHGMSELKLEIKGDVGDFILESRVVRGPDCITRSRSFSFLCLDGGENALSKLGENSE